MVFAPFAIIIGLLCLAIAVFEPTKTKATFEVGERDDPAALHPGKSAFQSIGLPAGG
jgi:hypothetical protein